MPQLSKVREEAIWRAVHDVITDLRIRLRLRRVGLDDETDFSIATAGQLAAASAVSAAKRPLRRKREAE